MATPATETAWLDAAHGKTVREVEELVTGHRPGDLPDDPTDPDLRPRILRFEVTPATFALFREAEQRLAAEVGHMLTDDETVAAMCEAVLTPTGAKLGADEPEPESMSADAGDERARPRTGESSRPNYQIALTVCAECDRGWQDGAGQAIEVGPEVIETARCDAQLLGRVDHNAPTWAPMRRSRSGSASPCERVAAPARSGCRRADFSSAERQR